MMLTTDEYKYMVIAFTITAVWDVILRLFSEEKLQFMKIEKLNWVVALRPYFEAHTVLAAALIAGFVGAITVLIIHRTTTKAMRKNDLVYLSWVALVSALVGIPMRYSGLFPHLKSFYYDPLPITTIFSDALSGIVVAATMLAPQKIIPLTVLVTFLGILKL